MPPKDRRAELLPELNVWREDVRDSLARAIVREAEMRHLAHQPPLTLEAWKRKRGALLREIRKKAATRPCGLPLDPQVHGVVRLNGYELRKLTFQSRPGMRVTANLYVPNGKGPFPAVLSVHGHWSQGKIAQRVQARSHILARSGFVALSVDAFGAGERGTTPGAYEYHGAGIGGSLLTIGETLLGAQVTDNQRAIDLLCSLPFVNADRIGVTGASGGGNQTMWVSALDPRVKAACPVVSVGTFEAYVTSNNCVCEVLPDGLTFLEEWAVLGLVAPNALLLLNSLRDSKCFSVPEMIRSFNDAREIYRLYGAADRIAYQAVDLPHGFWPEMQSAMLGWFKRWLKDEGDGRPAPLPVCEPLPEQDCLCFPEKNRPKSVCSIVEHVAPRARRMAARHAAGKGRIAREAKVSALRSLLHAREPSATLFADVGRDVRSGLAVRKFIIESEPGILLPVVLLSQPSQALRRVCVAAHPKGKPAAAQHPIVAGEIARGGTVALVDLRNTGETLYEELKHPGVWASSPYHVQFRSAFWLGRTMIGDWTTDLLAVLAHLQDALGARALELVGFEEIGLAALCASAMTTRLEKTVTVSAPGSYCARDRVVARNMSVFVPGILTWGDVSMMAALSRAPLEIVNPVDLTGEPYDAPMCEGLEAEVRGLAARCRSTVRATVRRDATEP